MCDYALNNNVRIARKKLGMDFETLVKKAKIPEVRLVSIEFGESAMIFEATSLCSALDMSLDELFPNAMKYYNDYLNSGKTRNDLMHDSEKMSKLDDLGIDFSETIYVAKIVLKNGLEFYHDIREQEALYVKSLLKSFNNSNNSHTFVLYSTSTHKIVLNKNDVLYISIYPEYEGKSFDQESDEAMTHVTIYFRNQSEKVLVYCEHDSIASFGECDLECQLQCMLTDFDLHKKNKAMDTFSIIDDEDQEEFISNMSSVSIMFVPIPMVCPNSIEEDEE